MAGTRTVHRGSRGRFAGSSGGKAEQVKVGRGYVRGGTQLKGGTSNHQAKISRGARLHAARERITGAPHTQKRKDFTIRALKVGTAVGAAGAVGYGMHKVGADKKAVAAVRLLDAKRAQEGPRLMPSVAGEKTVRGAQARSKYMHDLNSKTVLGAQMRSAEKIAAEKARTTYRGQGVGRVEIPRTVVRKASIGRTFIAGPGKARTAAKKPSVQPNYKSVSGTKEYVGRRLKPGEGRGFKIAGL